MKTKVKIFKKRKLQLTKVEEQIMQILWEKREGIISDIRNTFNDPKPTRNTISTIVRILEKKRYIGHKAYGNVHLYCPLISKRKYSKSQLLELMKNYFNNSFLELALSYAREQDLTIKELEELFEDIKKELSKDKKLLISH